MQKKKKKNLLELTSNAGGLGLGGPPGEGKSYPLQYSGLENPMGCIVSPWSHRVKHNWMTFTSNLLYFLYIYSFVCFSYCSFPLAVNP